MNNSYPIGLDLGYGYAKYYSRNGWGALPSAVATGYQASPEISLGTTDDDETFKGNVDAIFLSDQAVAVGKEAVGWHTRLDSTRPDFHRTPAAWALLQASLIEATRTTGTRPASINLTLTLPASNFPSQRDALLRWLDGKGDIWRTKFVDETGRTRQKTFSIISKAVLMQPQAHLLGIYMNEKGLVRNVRRVTTQTLVIDFGAGTADIGLFKKFRPHGEVASPPGGWQIIRQIEKVLKERLPEYNPDRFDIDGLVQGNGQLYFDAQYHDCNAIIEKALEESAATLFNHILGTVRSARSIPDTLIVGGWGERLAPYIRQHFPDARLTSDLIGLNGEWQNELPSTMPSIYTAAKGAYCYLKNLEAKQKA